jgi:meiosis-specific transcription factor NDT80
VKIAYRISAPMVVRGRSPGHYADERRAAGTPSPGGGGAGGNQQIGGHHPGGPGFMGADGLGPPSSGGPNQGMSMQHINAPAPSAHQHSTAVSITGGSPASQYTPIDPTLKEEAVLHMPTSYTDYTYVPVHEPSHLRQPPTGDSGYEQNNSYNGDRKSEHPLDISCPQYENDVATYNIPSSIPTNMPPASDSYRSKDGQSSAGAVPWLGSGAIVGREQRFGQHNIFPKCGTFQTAETSKGFYPDISPL